MNSFDPAATDGGVTHKPKHDRKALVARSLAEAQIIKDLKAAHEKTRAEVRALFADAGEREVGTLLDHRIGTVELQAGRETWTVVDPEAFFAWVADQCPDEIVTVHEVRSSFRDAVLAKCKADGGYVDWRTGAVEVPPGVAKRQSAPTIVERTEAHASFVVRHWLGDAAKRLGIEAGDG